MSTRPLSVRLGWLTLMLVLAGCGSDGTSTSGLDGSKKIVDLTHTERGQFCDWAVNKQGGYETCDEDSAYMGYPDRDACIHGGWGSSRSSNCQTTVSQTEACINSLRRCATVEDVRNSSACSEMLGC